jgi:uncharacterized protein YjdB
MKKKFILLSLIGGFCYVVLSGNASGPALMSGVDGTGASGAASCNGVCHTSTAGTSIVTAVQLIDASTMGVATAYTPGGSYFIRVSANNTSSSTTALLPRFGFQVSAVKTSTTTNVGTLSAIAGTHTATSSTGINLVEHSSAIVATTGSGGPGTTYSKDIPWTAPVAGTGSVTLRGIINAVNFNSASSGDISNASSVTVTEGVAGVAPITGTASVCVGATITLSDATTGGTWSSTATGIATISSTGLVTGMAPGTATISYVASAGTATKVVTVNPNPAAITGIPVVCPGGVTTLADATAGGTWSSSGTATATVSAAGVVTGVASGSVIITYALSTGCKDTAAVTVSTVPPITGTGTMCVGATTTLAHIAPGGSWSSSATTIATVGASTGVVTGVAAGTATISYSFGTSGCYATTVVTVNGAPVITGSSSVCVAHSITLTGSPAGGTWTSSNLTKATVGSSTGIVTGVATGTLTIKYKVTTTCGTDSSTKAMTVTPASPCVSAVYNPFAQNDELKLYPNPNRGTFSINVLSMTDEEAHIIVTNIVGEKVKEFDLATNAVNNVSLGQPAGIYFLSATTLNSKYFVKIVVE